MQHPPIPRLNPVFTIERAEVVLVTHLLGAVPLSSLRELVTDLSPHRAIILSALEVMMSGV